MNKSPFNIVCDAGPLIHLDELDCLDLLSDFQTIMVPEQVQREVEDHRPGSLQRSKTPLQIVSVPISESASFQAMSRALSLRLGEQAALSLMADRPGAIFLTDDAAARLAAEGMGYQVHGTIGVLLRAIRRGQRSPEQVLALLRDLPERSTLHIRPDLLNEIIAQVENSVS